MKNITITFSRSSVWYAVFSWAIMAAEGTPYSHVAIHMTDQETNQLLCYQASHTFVNCMSEPEFLAQEIVTNSFLFSVDDSIEADAKKFAESKLGVSYGTLGCAGLAIVQIASWFGIKMNNPMPDTGTFWCSEFVAAILENADCLTSKEQLANLTPKDLFPLIKSLPAVWHSTKP
jgi:hypothetical protein